eukprot:9490983-Pyramimonas_sp.AAC.1
MWEHRYQTVDTDSEEDIGSVREEDALTDEVEDEAFTEDELVEERAVDARSSAENGFVSEDEFASGLSWAMSQGYADSSRDAEVRPRAQGFDFHQRPICP